MTQPPFEGVIELTRREEVIEVTRQMILAAQRDIAIVSRQLDPVVYSHAELAEAMLRLARHNRNARIRILVQDNTALVRQPHRLQLLHQRLSSFVRIRRPGPDHAGFNEAFLVVDQRLWLHQPLADRYEARAAWDQPLTARELLDRFEEMWTDSREDPELRRLSL